MTQTKAELRLEIAAKTEQYLFSGGRITECAEGASGMDPAEKVTFNNTTKKKRGRKAKK